MQTFIPEPGSFAACVAVLDRQRLGKQRVETLQIMCALTELNKDCQPAVSGWINHPATRMWRGYEEALLAYQAATCHEWTGRGYVDTCLAKTSAVIEAYEGPLTYALPPWWGDYDVHASHRANLVRKMPEHYGPIWPDIKPVEGYVWPSTLT